MSFFPLNYFIIYKICPNFTLNFSFINIKLKNFIRPLLKPKVSKSLNKESYINLNVLAPNSLWRDKPITLLSCSTASTRSWFTRRLFFKLKKEGFSMSYDSQLSLVAIFLTVRIIWSYLFNIKTHSGSQAFFSCQSLIVRTAHF